MMRADALTLGNYPVMAEMTATKQIMTLHVFSMDKSK